MIAHLPLSVVVVFVLWRGAGAPPGMTEGAARVFTGAQFLLLSRAEKSPLKPFPLFLLQIKLKMCHQNIFTFCKNDGCEIWAGAAQPPFFSLLFYIVTSKQVSCCFLYRQLSQSECFVRGNKNGRPRFAVPEPEKCPQKRIKSTRLNKEAVWNQP